MESAFSCVFFNRKCRKIIVKSNKVQKKCFFSCVIEKKAVPLQPILKNVAAMLE